MRKLPPPEIEMIPRAIPRDSFVVAVTCPFCEGRLREVNIGKPAEGGTELNAVVRCTNCRREWGIHLRMMRVGTFADDGTIHGTPTALKSHIDAGEVPCLSCLEYRSRVNEDRTVRRASEMVAIP